MTAERRATFAAAGYRWLAESNGRKRMPFLISASVARGLAAVLLSALGWPAAAQPEPTYATQKQLTVAVTRFPEARAALIGFLRRRAARVQKQEETPEQVVAEFALPAAELPRLDSLMAALGFVLENNLNTRDLGARLQELRAKEASETARLATVNQQLRETRPEPDRLTAWEKQAEEHTDRLTRVRNQLAAITTHAGLAYVTLRLYDEVSFPTGNRRVTFVNMPGVEYSYLHLENPRSGLTSATYRGYAIKYLFTRGKSYFNLGVYKPMTTNAVAEDFVNELFMLNFGQDFYPRNFGRGRRRYLNLYTTYQVGGFILNRNRDERNEFIPNLNLGMGLELLKTRHVLLDTKAGYFVPLYARSRDLRGLLYQGSFNFVF